MRIVFVVVLLAVAVTMTYGYCLNLKNEGMQFKNDTEW